MKCIAKAVRAGVMLLGCISLGLSAGEVEDYEGDIRRALMAGDRDALVELLPEILWPRWRHPESGYGLIAEAINQAAPGDMVEALFESGLDPVENGLLGAEARPEPFGLSSHWIELISPRVIEGGDPIAIDQLLGMTLLYTDSRLAAPLLRARRSNSLEDIDVLHITSGWPLSSYTLDELEQELGAALSDQLQQDPLWAALALGEGRIHDIRGWLGAHAPTPGALPQRTFTEFYWLALTREEPEAAALRARLLALGADITQPLRGQTALQRALSFHNEAAALELLEASAPTSVELDEGTGKAVDPPVMLAWRMQSDTLLTELLARSPQLDAEDRDQRHWIFLAIERDDAAMVARIARRLSPPYPQSPSQRPLLAVLLKAGYGEIARDLIRRAGTPQDDWPALLFRAWDQNDEALARTLLDHGTQADADNVHERSVYHLLLDAGEYPRLFDWLGRSGQVDVRDARGRSLLQAALDAEAWAQVPRLLAQGVPMDVGALIDQMPVGELLPLLDQADGLPATALHRAAARGEAALVEYLLARGADPFADDDAGYWPAWHALLHGHDDALQALVAAMPAPEYAAQAPGSLAMGAPRLRWWSLQLWAGQHEALLADLQQHLAGDTVHPLAGYVWVMTHALRGTLATALDDQQVPDAVRQLARLHHALREDDDLAALAQMPADSEHLAALDPFSLDALMRSASQKDAWGYVSAALTQWPGSWQMLWSLDSRWLNDPVWRERLKALAEDEVLEGTPMATGLAQRLAWSGWGNEDVLQAARDWLAQVPNDARALQAVGSQLQRAGHEQAALDPVARAVFGFPFFSNRESLPRLLVDDRERVSRITAMMARWYQGPEDDPALLVLRSLRYQADACRAGGDLGCAAAQLALLEEKIEEHADALAAHPAGERELKLARSAVNPEPTPSDNAASSGESALPDQGLAWVAEFEALMAERDLDAAWALLQRHQPVPSGSPSQSSPSQQRQWLDNHLWWLAETVRRGRADPVMLREGLVTLEQFSEAGWWRGSVNHYRDILLEGLGDTAGRAENLRDWASWQRDSSDVLWRLVRLSETRHDAALYGSRMIARQPDNAGAWREHVQTLIYWLGRPVFALYRIEQAQALGHDMPADFVARARAQVGDNLSDFLSYRHRTGVSPSQRYVDWFNNARRNALSDDTRRVYTRFDGDMPEVEILLPNGEVQTQRVDPRHGMVVLASHGSAVAEADYDALGQLLAVRQGGVETLRLEYNSARQIVAARTREQQLAIAYNAAGKPARIHVRGLGEITVEYDDQGEILRVASDAGHRMALQVTQIFQQILASVQTVGRFSDPRELRLLDGDDSGPARWQARVQAQMPGSLAAYAARLAQAEQSAAARTRRSEYGAQAADLLERLFSETSVAETAAQRATALAAVEAWARLHEGMRPRGLTDDEFAVWSQMRLWLANTPYVSVARRDALRDAPLRRLEDRHGLQRSTLANEGYWHRHSRRAIHGVQHQAPRHQALLVRDNGEVLLGTSHGLFVLRQGYWQRFGYDVAQDRLIYGAEALDPAPERDVLALAETDAGLWLGTASGLILWREDGSVQHWRSQRDGLPSPRVSALQAQPDGTLWVGTAAGLAVVEHASPESQTLRQVERAPGRPILQLALQAGQPVVNTDRGLMRRNEAGDWRPVPGAPDKAVDALLADADPQRLLWLDAQGLHAQEGDARARRVLVLDDIPHSRRIHGLTLWPVGGEQRPVLLTDTGIALLREHAVEFLPLPLASQRGGQVLGPQQAAGNGRDLWLVAADGVYGWQAGRVQHHALGPVHDMATDPSASMAWVAVDNGIYLLSDEDGTPQLNWFSRDRARVVRSDGAGGLYTHDGWDILHYPPGATRPRVLFSAHVGHSTAHWNGPVRDLLLASDGSLWVVSGATLFRWQQDELTRFDYLDDPERFPSRSPMLFRVYETLQGDIHVVASNEGHLAEAGVSLRGGLLRLEGDRFVNLGQPPHWFVKAYTPVSDRLAILGTADAFVRERQGTQGGERDSYVRLEDPGYLAMGERASMLFLGGRGARLGDSDTWLFPSAGGVAAWHGGEWFYPDRLNQLLPEDQPLGQYGGRTVHAVAVIGEGLVLAGTDLGLLVYPAGSAAGLLSDHERGALAFAGQQQVQQQALADTFLEALARQSHPAARTVSQIRRLGQEIDQRDAELLTPQVPVRASDATAEAAAVDRDALRRELRERERQREQLLADLEREHRGLFQMLRLDPREASVLGSDLAPGQVLVQYLPTPERLLIHVVSREGAVLREVQVPADALTQRSRQVANGLRDGVHGQPQRSLAHRRVRSVADPEAAEVMLQEDLAWLYEHLLRPVEQELVGASQVFITPVGALTYVPFAALRRVQPDGRAEYAVQRFNMGVLPSLYHLNLVLRERRSESQAALFIADPDGTLPGALAEVEAVSALLPSRVLRGNEARTGVLNEAARGARIVHFATHGVLDPTAPAESYLVMGNGERLTTVDISLLDLSAADLVVLSACDSGVGINGLEYASLARAFAHARVPSVIASYWQVSDDATQALMERLYPHLRDRGDVYSALASAQRDMLQAGEGNAHPSAWASFAAFGRP